jgi:CRISPR system Cascade subunit CasA
MSRYNLIEENWIPVRYSDGLRSELGIQETLLQSMQLAAIEDSSPLVVAALHRFLLALLYRAIEGPTDIKEAKILFKGGLPGDKIAKYLTRWRDRFWLFDEKHPFFQVPDYLPEEKRGKKQWRSWTVLAAEHNADNAKVLFDHVMIGNAGSISAKQAAKWLIATQTFALGGGKSDFQYIKSGPSATATMALPLGKNLQDTLLLSLVPQNRELLRMDIPIWEREPEALTSLQKGPKRIATGWVDLYTWRTRSVKFNLQDEGQSISELTFASGVECSRNGQTDPMLSYRVDDEKGRLPIRLKGRGLWRDFDSLLPDESGLAPLVIKHSTALTHFNTDRAPQSVMVVGLSNKKAKINYWRMEQFALPLALSGDRCIRTEIRQLLNDAEDAQKSLWGACRSYARDSLSRGDREPSKGDISNLIGQLPAITWYWSMLECSFHDLLREYTLEKNPDVIRCFWMKSVRTCLQGAWDQHRNAVHTGDAWVIRALVKAEGIVQAKIAAITVDIEQLAFQEDTA